MSRPSWAPDTTRFQSLGALALMTIALSMSSDSFLTVDNLTNVLRQISVNLCLSMGMTLVILSGGIDLSVGSTLALSGAVAAGLLKHGATLERLNLFVQFTPLGAVAAGLATGAVIGLANGAAITRLGLPPFVATLGMLSIGRGLTMLWTGGFPVNGLGDEFGFIGAGRFLGLPMPIVIAAALALILHIVTKRTRFGRALYAVGGSERAAALSGLNVRRTKLLAYAICGSLAGVAGLITAARLDAATPDAGVGYELDSIAAAVIGGTSLSGGRGSILGAVLGCLIIGVLNNGLVLLGVSPYWQQVIKGTVILVAVAIDRSTRRDD
jgi:ribose transport system permease protein